MSGNVLETGLTLSATRGDRSHVQVWAIALAAGILAGVVGGLLGELVHDAFKPQRFNVKIAFTTFFEPSAASINTAEIKNATVTFTLLGGVIGAVMGLAGGFASRALAHGVIVGGGGLVAGSLAGGLASLGLLPFFFRGYVPDPNEIMSPILVHAGIWMAIAVVAGLAFALGMNRARCAFNAMVCACFGAMIATLVYHGLGEALFPDAGSTSPVAKSTVVRLLAVFLVTVLIAVGAARGALSRIASPASGTKDPSRSSA